MSKINLLPWREELKKVRNWIFYSSLGGTLLLSIIFIISMNRFLNYKINIENANIAYLNKELREVKSQVSEVQFLKENKKQLIDRMNIIQLLQSDRTSVVKLLDVIPKLIPEGLYLTQLSRKAVELPKDLSETPDATLPPAFVKSHKKKEVVSSQKKYQIIIQGVALTNGSISMFLKKLETVTWISDLKLNEISINKEGSGLQSNLGFVQRLTD